MFTRIRAIWTLMDGQRLRYGAAIAAMVVASCFLYLVPMVPQIAIDGVLADQSAEAAPIVHHALALLGGRAWLAENLWLAGVLIVALTAVAGVMTHLRGRWSAEACETIIRRTRDRVFDHLQHLTCRYFDSAETGDLIQRCTSDVETLRKFLTSHVVEIGRAVIMLLVPIPLMLAIDVRMTIASLLFLPIIVAFSYFYFRRIKRVFRQADEAEAAMTTTIQENLSGIRVVRAFARQTHEQARFADRNRTHQALDYRLYKLMAAYWSLSDFLCAGQLAIVVGAGVYWIAAGTLPVGAFFYFLTAVTMFLFPMRMMGRILTDLGKAQVALDRLQQILDEQIETTPEIVDPPETVRGEITFEHVSFSHDRSSPVLHDISLKVPAGTSIGILGPSGCGKSTIVNLLLRLYDYDSGTIRLDGRELTELDRRFVRTQMSVVMQEPFLYSKSLRDNLRLAKPDAGDEEIIEATRTACVHESILQFADGYDTLVGERGVTLSGGQRQRVALARALLTEPAILILDDALSAVDLNTENLILRALRERAGRHTTIVIAHRLSTVMHADQIVVLDHGRIIQHGTHDTLVRTDGLYKRLWQIQNTTNPLSRGASPDAAGSTPLAQQTQ